MTFGASAIRNGCSSTSTTRLISKELNRCSTNERCRGWLAIARESGILFTHIFPIVDRRTSLKVHPHRLVALLFCLAAACGAPSTSVSPASISSGRDASLRRFVDSLTDAPEFSDAHWGILIVDPSSGDTLYSRNAGKLFMPASNMKILTSATALTQLGAGYRYRTSFLARGPIADGTLEGDLLVVGR